MFKTLKSKLILLILSGFSILSQGQSFVLSADNFLPLYSGPIKWADLDNDNDLDIIYSGFADGANQYFIKVYENSNGSFASRSTNLPDIRNGLFSLGDYDKDGDLDILLTGLGSTGNISVLYKNNGSFSFSLKQSFPGLINATASWFDIDNDEDLDFLLAGVDDNSGGPNPFVKKMMVYENMNGNFSLITGTNLPPCTQCSMDWADSNGDGKIDLLITGFREDDKGYTELYLNNGDKTFKKDQNSIFKDVYNGDVKWGDFDNDGDMDMLLSGITDNGSIITSVYRNTGGVFQEEKDIQIQSTGENWMGATDWVDYNNDGLLDILISGRGTSVLVVEYVFKLYKNNGDGIFNEVSETNFSGISDSSVDFGDFDNDGDVDFCFSGIGATGPKTGIYKNKIIDGSYRANSKPTPPSIADFSERFFRRQVKIMWSSGTDTQTPVEGLSYNFYLKYGTSKIVVPTSDFTSGFVLTTNPSNGHGRRAVVSDIPEGNNSWAVQSVDGGKSGSLFSIEKTFYQINGPEAINTEIIDIVNIKLSWLDNSSIETSYHVARSTNPIAGFSPLVTLPLNTSSYIDNNAFLTDTYYYYRVNAANVIKASAYDSLSVVIPTAPANLLAQSISASIINLAWEDLSQYESGYEVQRKLSTTPNFQTLATLASNTKSYVDTGLSEGTRYDYRVRALVSNGSSVFSNITSAQTNFRPLGANFGKVTLEDETMNFSAKDFTDAFTDPDGSDQLVEIMIVNLSPKGTLKLYANPVIVGQIILQTDMNNLQFIPLPNANGVSSFSFYNNDGKDNSAASYTVTLTITPVNDVPAFSIPTTVEVNEDFVSPVKITPIQVLVPQDEVSQVVTYSILPITSPKVTMDLNPNTGEISLTSLLNEFGEVQFILIANDAQPMNNTFSAMVKLVIKAVNDVPAFSVPTTVEVNEDFATPVKITPIPAPIPQDEVPQVVTYSILPVTSDKVTMDLNSTTGEINLTSLPNEFGEVQFILIANDGQPMNNTFSATVKLVIKAVNDAPVFSSIPDQQVEYQSIISPIAFTVTDVDSPIISVMVTAVSDNQVLIKNENITIHGAAKEKSIVLLPEKNLDESTITLTASDGAANSSTQFKFKVFSVTGVSESMEMGVKIFPNPFATFINITLKEPSGNRYEAILFDQLGREVSHEEITTRESTITFMEIDRGIYILSIFGVNGDVLFRARLIKN